MGVYLWSWGRGKNLVEWESRCFPTSSVKMEGGLCPSWHCQMHVHEAFKQHPLLGQQQQRCLAGLQ